MRVPTLFFSVQQRFSIERVHPALWLRIVFGLVTVPAYLPPEKFLPQGPSSNPLPLSAKLYNLATHRTHHHAALHWAWFLVRASKVSTFGVTGSNISLS